MLKRFEVTDHPSDIGIIAYGSDLASLFANAAFGMFSLMSDPSKVKPKVRFEVEASGEDRESLLVNWLNELIFLEDTKKVILSEFKILDLKDKSLKASVSGEAMEKGGVSVARPVKAATYNQLKISEENGRLSARVIFDV